MFYLSKYLDVLPLDDRGISGGFLLRGTHRTLV